MSLVKKSDDLLKYWMTHISINTSPTLDKDGNTIGIIGRVAANGGWHDCSDFSMKDKDKRNIDLDISEFMTKVYEKTGYNPQIIMKAFSEIFEEIESTPLPTKE